jgi:hypothetical protein
VDKRSWEKAQAEWIAQTQALLDELPDDFSQCGVKAAEITHLFRAALARSLQPRLNAHIAMMPHETVAEKSALATYVNRELHKLGLAIRCPRTGGPAILTGDARDDNDEVGRFRLLVRGDSFHRSRTVTSATLFDLELIEDGPRQEGMSKAARQKASKSGGSASGR